MVQTGLDDPRSQQTDHHLLPSTPTDGALKESIGAHGQELHPGFSVKTKIGYTNPENQKVEEVACFYVHGMFASEQKQKRACEFLENLTGKEMQRVHNNYDPTFVHSIWNALVGLIDHSHGQRVERQAVDELKGLVQDALESGKKVEIYCFSQGSIITKNALQVLQNSTEHGWHEMCDRINVTFIGAMVDSWPVRHVRGIVKSGDHVVQITGQIGRIIRRFTDDQGHIPNLHVAEGRGHRLWTYGQILKDVLGKTSR